MDTVIVESRRVLTLPFDPRAAQRARTELRESLTDREAHPCLDDVELVATEVISNAVRHGAPLEGDVLVLSWRTTDERVEIAVRDGGNRLAPLLSCGGPAAEDDVDGRGGMILEALCERWWCERAIGGITVHAWVPCASA